MFGRLFCKQVVILCSMKTLIPMTGISDRDSVISDRDAVANGCADTS